MKKKSKRKNIIITLGLIFLISVTLISGPGSIRVAYAGENPSNEEVMPADNASANPGAVAGGAFEVTDYIVNANVGKDHSYDVSEVISVNIPQPVEKIVFSIPNGNFHISDIDVEDTGYRANIASGANTITINDVEKLSEGKHSYTIKYKIQEFEDRDSENDMFYFTVLPPEWKQPIGNVDITVNFPDDFPWEDMQCYAGQFGVQDVNNRAVFKADESSKTVSIKGEKIPENYGITLKAELNDSYWKGALSGRWVLIAIPCVMIGILLLLGLLWLIGGRDPKIEKTVENKPLEGIVPAEIGYIFNGEVSIRDILMIIIDFARKGYLKISEYEPKRYRLFRKEEPSDEEKFYRNAYNILFEDVYKERAIEMEDLGERLMRVRDAIKDDIAAGYASADSSPFTPLSKVFRYIGGALLAVGLGVANALTYLYQYYPINYPESLAVTVISAVAVYLFCRAVDRRDSQSDVNNRSAEIMSGAALLIAVAYVAYAVYTRTGSIMTAIALILAAVLSFLFISIMRARGKDNAMLVMRLRQLRNFIYHPTPKELLENHLADDNYYYDMLEYALTSGAEESWAISFLTLNVAEPDWYSDDVEGHAYSNLREDVTTVDFARDIKSFMRTIETAFEDLMRRRRRR